MPILILMGLLLIEFILWKHSMKTSFFQFRSIAFVGMMVMNGMFLIEVIGFGIVHEGFSFTEENILEIIKQFPQDFAEIVVILIGILSILMFISNIELMRKEGIGLGNLTGTFLGLLYVIPVLVMYFLNGILLYFSDIVTIPILSKIYKCLPVFFYCLIDYAECLIIGVMVMGYIAVKQKPDYDVDYVIIPGCAISKNGRLLPLLRGRVLGAVRYAWDQEIKTGKPVKYVPSGGQGADEIMSEGSAMELFLLSHGAESNEVLAEKKSTNTLENIAFSKALIQDENRDAKVAIATTNYHLLRCGMIAHKLGLEAEGIASKTKWYFWPNGFAREVVAIFVMTWKKHIFFIAVSLLFSILCII